MTSFVKRLCVWLAAVATLGSLSSPSALARYELTNFAERRQGEPVALPGLVDAVSAVRSTFIFQPEERWTYSHHPFIAVFKGRMFAMWSNGERDEDAAGQRVMISSTLNRRDWSVPRVLVQPRSIGGSKEVLTPAGFHAAPEELLAFFASYGAEKQNPRLHHMRTSDGKSWSGPHSTGLPVVPNQGPQRTPSGRLIMPGHVAYPWTEDPSAKSGWQMTGIYPKSMAGHVTDDPKSFSIIAREAGWPADLCEGSLIVGDDGRLVIALRNTRGASENLWVTESTDNGSSWGPPTETNFSNTNSKFIFGQLPDGTRYYVGNPIGAYRTPLVLSLSKNGNYFDRHFVVGNSSYRMKRRGRHKGGQYGYPATVVENGRMYIIVSREKEAIEVLSIELGELAKLR